MNFVVLRVEKLKSLNNVRASGQHTFRERPTPNAIPERTHLNESAGAGTAAELVDRVKARLPEQRRKDAVVCLEYVISASPEWFAKHPGDLQTQYLRDSIAWLKKKHGAENVVCTDIQRDEKTPHLVAYVVPRHPDGRLSAKEFTGGRATLSKMQTDFWRQVGARHGLDRGVEGSKAHHTTVKEFYAALERNAGMETPEPPPEPSKMDIVTGKALKEQREYAAKLAKHAEIVQKAASVAVLGAANRENQAKAIKALRGEVAELENIKRENVQVRQELVVKNHEIEAVKVENVRLKADLVKAKRVISKILSEAEKYLPTPLWEKLKDWSKDRGPNR